MKKIFNFVKKYSWIVISAVLGILALFIGKNYLRKSKSSEQDVRVSSVKKTVDNLEKSKDEKIKEAQQLRSKIDSTFVETKKDIESSKKDIQKVSSKNKDIDDSINSWNDER